MAETKLTKNEIAAKSRQSGWGYINASATGFTVSVSAGTSNQIGASYIGFSWTAEA